LQFTRAATEDRDSASPKFDLINYERTQSSGWLYDVDHKLLERISKNLDHTTGLHVAKTDPISIKQFPYDVFESEAFQVITNDSVNDGVLHEMQIVSDWHLWSRRTVLPACRRVHSTRCKLKLRNCSL
jgi:hypothetical protein